MDSSDQLVSLLERCTVRLSTPSESGTGFFVAPGLILTCAHVVGDSENNQTIVTVQWEGQIHHAKIIRLLPSPYPDLALLNLEDALATHPCVLLHEAVLDDDKLRSYGYSERYSQGDPASFVFEGMTGGPKKLLKFKEGEAVFGFSGAPLLNRRTGCVCGVLSITRGQNTPMGGRGIPTSVVLEQFEELATLQKEFHNKDRQWYDLLPESEVKQFSMTTAPQTGTHIFVSHSSNDNEFGVRLVQDLRRELGSEDEDVVWYDSQGGLMGGEAWWDTIVKELTARPIFIVILSPDALDSRWVRDEIRIAWKQKNAPAGKHIIPIHYKKCKVPEDLDTIQAISFLSPEPYENAFQKLLAALSQKKPPLLASPGVQGPKDQRKRILQILYEERSEPIQTFDREDLARLLGKRWHEIQPDVAYLEEKGYLITKHSQIRTRIFHMLSITAEGVDFVESGM